MLSLVKLARLVLLRWNNQIELPVTMPGEEIGPDFDIGINEGNTELDVWQSDKESEKSSSSSEKGPDEPIGPEEQVKRDIKVQLQRLIESTEKTNEEQSSDERDSKRRRLSRSRSKTVSRSKSSRGETPYYTDPAEIARIFGTKLSPQSLCSLSTMAHGTPADILKLVRDATVSQICKMCQL